MSTLKRVATAWCCVCALAVTTVGHSQVTKGRSGSGSAEETKRRGALAKEKQLVVPNGAEQVEYPNGPGAPGSIVIVSYLVREPYPAKTTLAEIREHLDKAGWKPLKKDWLNPTVDSSQVRGWYEYKEMRNGSLRNVREWSGQWRDANGAVIAYSLNYLPGKGPKEGLDKAGVSGVWFSPSEAEKMMRFGKKAGSAR
jgi:hypothetical protein